MDWLISANSSIYDYVSSFEHFNCIDWRQGNAKYGLGDTIYIYCTRPLKKIRYKCIVEKIDLLFSETRDDKQYWIDKEEYKKSLQGKYMRLRLAEQVDTEKLNLESLLENGLKRAPQSSKKIRQ